MWKASTMSAKASSPMNVGRPSVRLECVLGGNFSSASSHLSVTNFQTIGPVTALRVMMPSTIGLSWLRNSPKHLWAASRAQRSSPKSARPQR